MRGAAPSSRSGLTRLSGDAILFLYESRACRLPRVIRARRVGVVGKRYAAMRTRAYAFAFAPSAQAIFSALCRHKIQRSSYGAFSRAACPTAVAPEALMLRGCVRSSARQSACAAL